MITPALGPDMVDNAQDDALTRPFRPFNRQSTPLDCEMPLAAGVSPVAVTKKMVLCEPVGCDAAATRANLPGGEMCVAKELATTVFCPQGLYVGTGHG
jgi:hypothetical protein